MKIRVAHIITGFGTGGAERLLLDLNAAFDRSRFEVTLISVSSDLAALTVYGYPDVEVAVFDLGGAGRVGALLRLRAFLDRLRPDIVHAHMFHGLVAAFAATRFLSKRPAIVFTSHLNNYAPTRAAIVRALRAWRAADIVFTSGQHHHLNARRTLVIPNGVAVAEVAPQRRPWRADGPVRLLAVGRLADQKDPLGLLHTLRAADLPHATLEFIGDGPLRGEAEALSETLGLSSRVTFHGVRSDVGHFLGTSDVFVMHSKYEGMPIALLEGAAQAMPVIATPVGAVADVIGPDGGVLAEPRDFAAALHALCGDPTSAIEMGRRLHRRVHDRFSLKATAAAHEALYESLIPR